MYGYICRIVRQIPPLWLGLFLAHLQFNKVVWCPGNEALVSWEWGSGVLGMRLWCPWYSKWHDWLDNYIHTMQVSWHQYCVITVHSQSSHMRRSSLEVTNRISSSRTTHTHTHTCKCAVAMSHVAYTMCSSYTCRWLTAGKRPIGPELL